MLRPFKRLKSVARSAIQKVESLIITARLTEKFKVKIKQTVSVPLRADLTLPICADIFVDTVIDATVDIPLEFNLDQTTLGLEKLDIVIDETIHIKDTIELALQVPLDSTIKAYHLVNVPVGGNLPLNLKIPLDQSIAIKGHLHPRIVNFSVPFKKTITVPIQVPVKQKISIRADVLVALDHSLRVPLDETLELQPGTSIKIALKNLKYESDD